MALRKSESGSAVAREDSQEWFGWTLALTTFVSVSMLVMVFLWQYALVIKSHYQVVALRDRARVLDRERAVMQLQIQSLSSLERVEKVAVTRLGMLPPVHRQVLDLRKIQSAEQVSSGAMAKK